MSLSNFLLMLKGGPKSGNYGHSGRPGKRGGSTSKVSSSLSELGYDSSILDEIAKRKTVQEVSKYLQNHPEREKYLDVYYHSKSFTSGDEEGRSVEGFSSTPLSDFERSLSLAEQGKLPSRGYVVSNLPSAYLLSKLPESSISAPLYRGSDWEGKLTIGEKVSFDNLGKEFSTIDPQIRGGSAFGSRKYIFVKEKGKAVDLREFSNHPEEQPFLVKGSHTITRIDGNRVYIE